LKLIQRERGEVSLEEQMLRAIRDVFYSGERVAFRKGEMVVGIVPPEDIELLEEIERPEEEVSLV